MCLLSSWNGLFLILGLIALSAVVSLGNFEIQLKFISILLVGLISIVLAASYTLLAFEEIKLLGLSSMLTFYISAIHLSKSHTALQETNKNKKEA